MSRTPHEWHRDLHLASTNSYEWNEGHHLASSSNQPNQSQNQNHNNGHDQNRNAQHDRYTKPLITRPQNRTGVLAKSIAAICTIFWVAVILLGLAVLIVYLMYRPKSPQFEIAAASLNAGYIDNGNLLNADISLLAKVTNPNKKVNIYFSYSQLNLYFQGIIIGTQVINKFYEPRGTEALRNIHMITSALALPLRVAQEWGNETQAGGRGVTLHLVAKFKTRWFFGRWLRQTIWFKPSCEILLGLPPNGVLLNKKC